MDVLEINPEAIDMTVAAGLPVRCPECGWFGSRDDCQYGRCPSCGERVEREAIYG
jgi:predicted RNA-binding Zn-ribbon protein involved in translation (DUF1610 family)